MIAKSPDIFPSHISAVRCALVFSLEIGQEGLIKNIGMGKAVRPLFVVQDNYGKKLSDRTGSHCLL